MRKTKAEKAIDKAIEKAYYRHCSGIQIMLMDIPKIFAEGKKAIAEGRDLDQAIITFVNTISKN